ncbi:MAG TPA: PepSY domain-containing protein [Vicinamibacterales bacterium]|nr:PepSY domain-containing protein [Vicinamibacterales bacterium]
MHFNVANRKVHYWAAFSAALPLLVIISSGILLQMKKQWDWVQPPEHRGSSTVPAIDFDRIMASLQGIPSLGVTGWDDVDRIDVRPGRGIAKITLMSRWEVQVDLDSGHVLQTAYRRSDLIESIHDGSFLAGDWTKLGLFLPAGLVLLLLWLSGVWMVWVQLKGKRRGKRLKQRKAAALVAFTLGLPALALAQQRALAVDPLVGHWEIAREDGETIVLADARKWRTDKTETRFPLAAVRGVGNFTAGVMSVKFKLIAGESDQIAGLAFGISPAAEYYYARYNTKDGNVALWRFEGGDRHRLLDGTEHLQFPLNVWHELRVEVRGTRVTAAVNGTLRIEHTLPAPVSGRVGFYTKRDSTTAFKAFTIR